MNNELKHYGVIGMKWGVRRYENKDGTLTAAGRKRYGSDRKTKVKEEKPNYYVSKKQVKRNMNHMTDQELQRAINRINMQNQVNKMNPDLITYVKDHVIDSLKGLETGVKAITGLYFAYMTLNKVRNGELVKGK